MVLFVCGQLKYVEAGEQTSDGKEVYIEYHNKHTYIIEVLVKDKFLSLYLSQCVCVCVCVCVYVCVCMGLLPITHGFA